MSDCAKLEIIKFLTRNLAFNLSAVKIMFAILDEKNFDEKQSLEYLKVLALKAGIDEKIQEENIGKTSNKGRK